MPWRVVIGGIGLLSGAWLGILTALHCLVSLEVWQSILLARYPHAFRIGLLGKAYLTAAHHHQATYWLILAWILYLMSIGLCIIFYKSGILSNRIALFIPKIPLSSTEVYYILFLSLIIILHRIYFFVQSPFMVDELFAYTFFVREYIDINLWYYPEPNCHILFNLIAHFFGLFFYYSPALTMRLPSLVANVVMLVSIFVYLRQRIGFWAAWWAVFLVAFAFPTAYYATQGRGYMLMAWWAWLNAVILIEYLHFAPRERYVAYWVGTAVLGFYTLPSFLLYFLGAVAYWGLHILYGMGGQRKQSAGVLLRAIFFVSTGVLLLYLPVIMWSGAAAIVGNKWIVVHEASHYYRLVFPIAAAESLDYLLGVSRRGWVWLIGLAIGLGLCRRYWWTNKWIQALTLLLLALVVLPALYLLYTRIFPPYRTWVYMGGLWCVWLGAVCGVWYSHKYTYWYVRVGGVMWGIFFLGYQLWYAHWQWLDEKSIFNQQFYREYEAATARIVAEKPTRIYVHDYFFHFALRAQQLRAPTNYTLDAYPTLPQGEYDWVILFADEPLPSILPTQKYEKVFRFKDAQVYRQRRLYTEN